MINQEQKQFLLENYTTLGKVKCQEKTGLTINQITKFASKNNLKINRKVRNRLLSEANKGKIRPKSRKAIELSHLNNIKNPWVAYTLGLIWADGHVSYAKTTITLIEEDMEIVKAGIQNLFPFSFFRKSNSNFGWQKSVTAYYNSANASEALWAMGFKDKTCKSPHDLFSSLDKEMKIYFLRGLFDGDGCVHNTKGNGLTVNFTSHYNQNWVYLENFCKANNIEYRIRKIKELNKTTKKENSRSVFYFLGRGNHLRFCNLIWNSYPKDKIGLDRKYKIFINYLANSRLSKIKIYLDGRT